MNCYYKNNWYKIYDIEDFEELMDEDVYACLIEFVNNKYKEEIYGLNYELYFIENENEDLLLYSDELQDIIYDLEEEIKELKEKLNAK